MTFVTLSAGYGGPTIGVGYEFLRSLLAESRISQEQVELIARKLEQAGNSAEGLTDR